MNIELYETSPVGDEIQCEECGTRWSRPRQRGRKPKRCDDCKAFAEAARLAGQTRQRSTQAELADLDDAIERAVMLDYPVTLRGVYYRCVSAGAVDKTEAGYHKVGRRLLTLRRTGRVDYSAITDGTRWTKRPRTHTDLDEMLEDAAASYRRALWHDQEAEVMVFTEKDAISGVLWPVTARWDVPMGVLRGFSSESYAWSVAESIYDGVPTYVYQLGDHDPSGVAAWDNFVEKITGFLAERGGDFYVNFERLAVTPDQIIELNLPTRPTKKSDPRAKNLTGDSVEVDAIPAPVLRDLVESAITQHIDQDALRLTRIAEKSERDILTQMIGLA